MVQSIVWMSSKVHDVKPFLFCFGFFSKFSVKIFCTLMAYFPVRAVLMWVLLGLQNTQSNALLLHFVIVPFCHNLI